MITYSPSCFSQSRYPAKQVAIMAAQYTSFQMVFFTIIETCRLQGETFLFLSLCFHLGQLDWNSIPKEVLGSVLPPFPLLPHLLPYTHGKRNYWGGKEIREII